MSQNDSHISQPDKHNEKAPIKQHHRMALGERVNGQSDPNGAPKASTTKKIGNAPCTY